MPRRNIRRRKSVKPVIIFTILAVMLVGGSFGLIVNDMRKNEQLATPVISVTENGASAEPDEQPLAPIPDFVIERKPEPPRDDTVYDYVITNARLINPETGSDISGMNIGIIDDTIAAVTRRPLIGTNVVDATGLVAAPGFIDIVTYEPNEFGVRFKIADGVTTNLLMHGGSRNTALWYENWGRNPPNINYGASNFINSIRSNAMSYGSHSVMRSESSLNTLIEIVETNIQNGALGISMSPEYFPGVQGEEMLRLSQLAERYNLVTYYHLRYSTHIGENNSLKGIQEVINLARETGVSVHIMHITSTGSTNCADEAFAMIDAARAEGFDITADIYPYDYWATYLNSARFSSGWQQRFNLTYSDLQLAHTTERLTAETFPIYRADGRLVMAMGSIPEHEIQFALQHDYVFIGSDTILESHLDSHPRGAGTYARLIGRYARDLGVITLMEAIEKATLLPARRLESASPDMKRKGRIEVGADADIVLFDYDRIIDKATPENVAQYSEGVRYVFVNGKLVFQNNVVTNLRAGKPVKNYIVHPEIFPETRDFDGLDSYQIYDGKWFVSLDDAAGMHGIFYDKLADGMVIFGNSRLFVGLTDYTVYGQESHLSHEPIIYRGRVFVLEGDLVRVLY
jgi:dihydroorotase